MMELRTRDYEPKDFVCIEVDDHVKEFRKGQKIEEWAAYHVNSGPCCTVVDQNDEIVFCAGVDTLCKGAGEIWAVFSPLATKYLATIKMIQDLIKYIEYRGYHRLFARVCQDWPKAVELIERLGFKRVNRVQGPNDLVMALYELEASNG